MLFSLRPWLQRMQMYEEEVLLRIKNVIMGRLTPSPGGLLNQCLTTTNGPRTYLSERSCRSPTTTLRLQIAVVWQTFRKWSSYYLGYEAHFVNIPSPQDLLPNDMQLFMIHQCTHRTLKMVSKGKPSTSVHAFVQGVLAWVCTWSKP